MPSLLQRPPARTPGPVRSLPPAAAPPSPPRPLIPPGLPPPSVCGGEGGALTGGGTGRGRGCGRGGASVACVMGPPTCAILGRVSRLELARPCAPLARRSWHRAGKTRPARTSGTECPPALCAPNCSNCGRPARRQSSGTPGNGIPACASSTGVRAGAPRAAHSFAAFPALHRPAAAVA